MARTAGRSRPEKTLSWVLLGGLGLLAVVQPSGCGPRQPPGGGNKGPAAVVVADALAAVGPEVVLPALDAFLAELGVLEAAIADWEADLAAGGDGEAARAEAQARWRSAMLAWQQLELMQIGPAASSLTAVAGADIRDEIYSWPTTNPCRVDQEVVAAAWDQDAFFSESLVNVYGLDAMEHLLFGGAENACPGQVNINQDGSWDALGQDGVNQNRAAYAAALAAEIRRQADGLHQRWSPDGGNFSGAIRANTADSPYETEQLALNAIFDALFYLELRTKDGKLAQPLGLVECGEERCPDDVEHLESGLGAAAIAANLRGFRALFTGGEGTGLDDLLVELDHGDITQTLLQDIDAAIALADGIEMPLDEAIESDPASVEALYQAVKAVTDDLKGDLATVLALQVPQEAAGDND